MDNDSDRTVVRSSAMQGFHVPRTEVGLPHGGNALPAGTRLGEFEILDLIGEGGFGIVYLAYDHSLDRRIAMKEYMPSGMASRTQDMHVTIRSRHYLDTFNMGLRSFVNEARMLARFDSPSLVKVYRFWEQNGTAYMVMPFYDGLTLKQALKDRMVVPDEEWIRAFIANLLNALDMIHAEQCYHRDIAPDNILMLKDGRPLLLDFGAARRVIGDLTQGPTVILKPGFAPIEQYADIPGLRQGSWTDIYALGAVVYFLITGKTPPPSVARVLHDDMKPAREAGNGRYSAAFLETIDKTLAVRPEQRIQSADELRQALGIEEAGPRTMPMLAATRTQTGRRTGVTRTAQDGQPSHTGVRQSQQGDGDDWLQTMVADPRQVAAPAKSSKLGWVVSGLLLMMMAGAGTLGYYWMNLPASRDVAVAAPEAVPAPATTSGASSSDDSSASGSVQAPPAPTAPTALAAPIAPDPSGSPTPDMAAAPAAPAPAPAPAPQANGKPGTDDKPASEAMSKQAPARPAPPAPPALSPEDELWRVATAKDTPGAYQTYLKRYPRGKHAAAAKLMIEDKQTLAEAPVPPAATPGTTAAPTTSTQARPAPAETPKENRIAGKAVEPSGAAPRPEPPAAPASAARSGAQPPAPSAAAGGETASAPPPRKEGETSDATPPVAMAAPSLEPPRAAQPKVEPTKPEPPKQEAAKTDMPKQETPVPPAVRSEPQAAQRTLKLPGQTMTGSFTPDPVTGIVSGSGQISWDNGDRFEGRLVKGVKEGKGRFTWANGQQYTGDWSGDQPNGKGVLQFANGNRYEGEVRNGEPHGQGTTRFRNGDVYTGGWVKGKHHGKGRYTWVNGTYWEGEFRDGQKTENGHVVHAQGRTGNGAPAPGTSSTTDNAAGQLATGAPGK